MPTRDEIATVVLAALRDMIPEREAFDLKERFTGDLKLHTDDATQIVLDVERALGVRVERKKWLSKGGPDRVLAEGAAGRSLSRGPSTMSGTEGVEIPAVSVPSSQWRQTGTNSDRRPL